jgi:HK97 family phage prohead protease
MTTKQRKIKTKQTLKTMTVNNIEKRYTFSVENQDKNTQFRAKLIENNGNNDRHIRGYGVVFGQKSKIITEYIQDKGEYRTFNEIINSRAFDKLIANNYNGIDVILNVNHEFDQILARLASGTLTLNKDNYGMTYETDLPETARGEDVLQMVGRGDYYESSFQFIVAEGGDKWEYDQNTGLWTRTIFEIDALIDMCVASFRGCYSNTDISVGERLEYEAKDIEVAARKLNELMNSTNKRTDETIESTENMEYQAELELDADKLKLLAN